MLYILGKRRDVVKASQEDFDKWAARQNNSVERLVGNKKVGDCIVCTSFLCIDKNEDKLGSPRFFESIVLKGNSIIEFAMYETWEQAEEGHQMLVDMASNGFF